jgi:hypothetical protein
MEEVHIPEELKKYTWIDRDYFLTENDIGKYVMFVNRYTPEMLVFKILNKSVHPGLTLQHHESDDSYIVNVIYCHSIGGYNLNITFYFNRDRKNCYMKHLSQEDNVLMELEFG